MANNTESKHNVGKVVQIIGPVLDVEFEDDLPAIYNALHIKSSETGVDIDVIAEVEQHLGESRVRAVAMKPTDGMQRGMSAVDLGRKFEDAGVCSIIYTDIDRDGTMKGLNVQSTIDLANALTIPVIASGGVASLNDLSFLKEAAKKATGTIEGAISGRALYDGSLDIRQAIALLKGNS